MTAARSAEPLRQHASAPLLCLLLALMAGCAPKADQSGWEMARKKDVSDRLESYPEIPLVLPAPVAISAPPPTSSPMEGVRQKKLDPASLFRRGFSAPTP